MLSDIHKVEPRPKVPFAQLEEMPVVKTGDRRRHRSDQQGKPLTPGDLEDTLKHLNSMMEQMRTNIVFSIDEESSKVVIKVINSLTEEVIRQIPPDEVLRIASHISKLMGIFVDESA